MIEIIKDWCKGCDICVQRCPVQALEISDEEGESKVAKSRLIIGGVVNEV
jgi:Na+-translocating ferredoxin:NAD+ oxidoreductase RNF subunit RnfB